ncbi:GLE1-like protein-domain-containing protein [Boletus edulis BED1]|uniref:mRNA export factor GLE1 n=1 Tax=Boletus edulis BED1 TaxID=1328754 RepID=A0AAD4BZ34_BOLED|nr:GLE1-like protein-domain-containing protein [Boletus edulis BED1]
MRYGLPRSPSPPPVRRQPRRTSGFGLLSDSESEPEEPLSDAERTPSSPSSLSDSVCFESDEEPPAISISTRRPPQSPSERRHVEETVAAIRLRTRHHDPYEEWEKQTRKDALRTARREQTEILLETREQRARGRDLDLELLAAKHEQQMAEVQKLLSTLKFKQQSDLNQLRVQWNEQDRLQHERIERGIRIEEENHRKKLEAERKKREEEERQRKLEEERRLAEEEKKRHEEEERRKQKEAEEAAQRARDEAEREKRASLAAAEKRKSILGITPPDDDWFYARQLLKNLKAGPMRIVKADGAFKPQWNAIRRQITPKIGQLTQDQATITRITNQILELVHPQHALPQPLYLACLSSLAKAILLQAETEVTAEKKSAIPLALVTANLLERLPVFSDVFFAKLVQRSGGWPVPCVIPSTDVGSAQWEEAACKKAMGYRVSNGEQESMGDYVTRISGMMRVYFLVLVASVTKPLDNMFRLPRYWTYFARMLNDERLLSTAVAAQLLYTALDVGGMEAKHVWGKQWVKLLELLYEAATVGIGGKSTTLLGGQTPEGKAACVRVQLEIENIVRSA